MEVTRQKPDSHFHCKFLHVSDHIGGSAKSRQEKGTVSSRCHFLICFPVLTWQSDVKKYIYLETFVPKNSYELGDVVSEDRQAKALPLEAGIRPASNRPAQVSALI